MNLSGTSAWRSGGPGPQCPNSAACTAGVNGLQMWTKRGSTLYIKWNFGWDIVHPATAIRLTEINPDTGTCGTATLGGPVDLRCVGNADPMYYSHEPFANNPNRRQQTVTIDGDNALAVDRFSVWVCLNPGFPYNEPLTPGLAGNGLAHQRLHCAF